MAGESFKTYFQCAVGRSNVHLKGQKRMQVASGGASSLCKLEMEKLWNFPL